MIQETIKGKPERVSPIPKPQIQPPASNEELMSQANRDIADYTKAATGARHTLGRGLPADHPALQ